MIPESSMRRPTRRSFGRKLRCASFAPHSLVVMRVNLHYKNDSPGNQGSALLKGKPMSTSGVVAGGNQAPIRAVSAAVVTTAILASSCVCSSVLALFGKCGTLSRRHANSSLWRYCLLFRGTLKPSSYRITSAWCSFATLTGTRQTAARPTRSR